MLSHNIDGSPPRDSRVIENKEIVGQATNIITSKILKGNIENNNKNYVFSPIGYASILAILGEGAHYETNNDIATVLKHPNNRELVRGAYRSVLSHLQGLDPQVAPQFRSWFYIYKNNTIEDSYRQILVDDFHVTVRNVEPYNPPEEQQQTAEVTTNSISVGTTETNDDEAKQEAQQTSTKSVVDVQVKTNDKPINSKDIVAFDSFKMEAEPVDETRIDTQNDASKFDEVIEDRQYVEVPLIKDETEKAAKNEVKGNMDTEKMDAENVKVTSERNDSKKVALPLKHYEEMEIMQAAETRLGKVVSLD